MEFEDETSLSYRYDGFGREVSRSEEYWKMFENEKGRIQFYPSGSNVTVQPYKTAGKIGSVATVVSNVLDIGNTWSNNNGNTNLKRIGKTAIQLGGGIYWFDGYKFRYNRCTNISRRYYLE